MPQRASLRLQGIASDGTMVAEELRGGQIVLSSATGGSSGQPGRAPVPREPDQPRAMPTGTLHRAGSNVKHLAAFNPFVLARSRRHHVIPIFV